MNIKDFNRLAEARLNMCKDVMALKNKEYASDHDKLQNFKDAAAMKGETPERALYGMWAKHLISVKKIIDDLDKPGKPLPETTLVSEKITDNINYLILLEALLAERRESPKKVAGF